MRKQDQNICKKTATACKMWIQLLQLGISSPLQVSERLRSVILFSFGSLHKTLHVQRHFPGVSVRIQPDGSATSFYLSGDCNHVGFQVLHSKLGYCTCVGVRHFLSCTEIEMTKYERGRGRMSFSASSLGAPGPCQLQLLLRLPRKRSLHKADNLHWAAAGGSKHCTVLCTSGTHVATAFIRVSTYNSGKVVG